MIAISLDQALQTSGYCIWKDNLPEKVGIFKTKSTYPIDKRLGQIWEYLSDLYAEYEFEFLACEDIQQQSNPQTYKKLAYVQAAIFLWCYFNDIQYMVLSPSAWRSETGGGYGKKREEQKENCIKKVKEKYGVEVSSDEADAVMIGAAAISQRKKNISAF